MKAAVAVAFLDLVLGAGNWIDLVGGFAFTALGVAMLFARPRRVVTRAFAVFGICFGGAFFLRGLTGKPFEVLGDGTDWTAVGLEALSAAVLVMVVCLFPAVNGPKVRRARTIAGVLAVSFATWWLVSTMYAVPIPRVLIGDSPGFFSGLVYPITSIFLSAGSLAFAAFAWALVHAALPPSQEAARRSARRVAAALGFFFGIRAGLDAAFTGSIGNAGGYANYFGILTSCLLIASIWAAQAGRPDGGRACRTLALLFAILPVLALASGKLVGGGHEVWGTGLLGLGRILMVFVIAYGVLREQLFDIDIRLKWTLSRGTIAAVFLAVFFVFAQLGQNFLSDRFGWASGGAAAGLLLFAIAPIQRAAERLSDKAMPNVRPSDPRYILAKKRETYRNAYATAWADGNMTPKDVRMLHQVREALGLPDQDIVAIEKEWAKSAGA